MRKSKILISILLVFTMILSFGVFGTASASSSGLTADDWRPYKYVESGFPISTDMTCNQDGTITFSSSDVLEYRTMGFMLLKPIEDVSNFTIDLDLNVPQIDKILWMSFAFLDTSLVKGNVSTEVTDIAQPFNATNIYGGYENPRQNGAILQFWPMAEAGKTEDANAGIDLKNNNSVRVVFAEKTLDCRGDAGLSVRSENASYDPNNPSTYANGYGLQSQGSSIKQTWHELRQDFVKYIKFDGANIYDSTTNTMSLKVSLTPSGQGVGFDINDGAWKAYNGSSYADAWGELNLSNNKCKGFKDYFTTNDCYFSFAIKYQNGLDSFSGEDISVKVKSVNGELPNADLATPTYANAKTVKSTDNKFSMDLSTDKLANSAFGVYPYQATKLKVTQFDEDDDYYTDVTSTASRIGMTLLDYVTVEPVDKNNKAIPLKTLNQVKYEIGDTYKSAKVYYLNSDDEIVLLEDTSLSDGVLTFSVDNKTVKKVAIFGSTASTSTNNGGTTGGGESGGCMSAISGFVALPLVLAGAVLAVKKRKNK